MDAVLTRLHVKKLYEAYPEDLLCIPIEVLRQAYQSDSSPDDMKIAIIAELFVRDFLSYHTDREAIDFINGVQK